MEEWERPLEIISMHPVEGKQSVGEMWLRVYIPKGIKNVEIITEEDLKKEKKKSSIEALDMVIGEKAGNTEYSAFNESGAVNGYNIKRKEILDYKNKLTNTKI